MNIILTHHASKQTLDRQVPMEAIQEAIECGDFVLDGKVTNFYHENVRVVARAQDDNWIVITAVWANYYPNYIEPFTCSYNFNDGLPHHFE